MKNKNIKKEFGYKEVRVEMGMFEFDVLCIVGHHRNLNKYARWKFEDDQFSYDSENARGCCLHRLGYVPVIWLPKKPRTAREHATLAHECLHAVCRLFDWAGMKMSRDNEEVVTHAMSHLVTNILEKL